MAATSIVTGFSRMTAAPAVPASLHRPATGWRPTLLVCGLVIAAALRSAWSTMDRYFIGDDFAYVSRFLDFTWAEWPALFVRDWSGGMWGYVLPELRPFAALTFMVDAQFWGINPLGYHLTNFMLDAGCGCLVALIAWRLLGAPAWVGVAAGILFACHPAHAEPVAWITGRVDLAGTFCYLAGFLAAGRYVQSPGRRSWLFLAWGIYAAGCFTKEFCLTMPIALLLWAMICGRRTIRARPRQILGLVAGFLVAFGIYAACRWYAFGDGGSGSTPANFLSPDYLWRQHQYLRWMLLPVMDVASFLPRITPLRIVVGAGLIVALLAWWRRAQPASLAWRTTVCFGIGWYAVATLPLVVVGYFSPRHLYLATAGACLAFTFIVAELAPRRWMAYVAITLAIVLSTMAFDRAVAPWRHSAKVSEALSAEIARTREQMTPGHVLLLDVPEVYEGAWMWSWATPFALQRPFLAGSDITVVERPAVFVSDSLWRASRDLGGIARAPGAILMGIDESQRGKITRQVISAAQLARAAPELALEAPSDDPRAPVAPAPDVHQAWRRFVQVLKATPPATSAL